MPAEITITAITGAQPYDIYICDDPVVTCLYVDTISSVPYSFNIPPLLDGQLSYTLKVVDNVGCVVFENLSI
jgi:hypothetical protein